VLYAVRIACDDKAVHTRFLAWLEKVHIADVLAAGAEAAQLYECEPAAGAPACAIEVHYRFRDRQALSDYLEQHAPRLREHGLAQFGAGERVQFQRTIAECKAAFGPVERATGNSR
jgi:hypothetical protein